MGNVFIIHGAFGHPNENWFPWLKSKLEKLGQEVFVPAFPTPEKQSLENWLKVFGQYKKNLGKDSVVVGHSLGVPFLLSVLEELDTPIKAAFFVAGFTGLIGNRQIDQLNSSIAEKSFDWQRIRKRCRKFFVFHSDNDPFVSLEKARELAKSLCVELILVKGAGHFNEKAGYNQFGLLLEKIKKEL